MTVTEVAKILRVSNQRVCQLIQQKRLWARVYRDHGGMKRFDIRDAVVRPPLRKYRRARR